MKNFFFALVVVAGCCMLFLTLNVQAEQNNCKTNQWKITSKSSVNENPNLIHVSWERERPPYGAFDKITLHRIFNKNKIGKRLRKKGKVLFMIPGSWERGWSNFTEENASSLLFYANRGYDVYSIDFRTNFLPNMSYSQFQENGIDTSSTIDWTLGLFREDIKICVDKIKMITKQNKIFMMGFSRGGVMMWVYANKYQNDLKGLISIDGYAKDYPPTGQIWDEQLYYHIIDLLKKGMLKHPDDCMPEICTEPSGYFELLKDISPDNYETYQLAGVMPYARVLAGGTLPIEFQTISDYVADEVHYKYNEIGWSNYYGGYIEKDVLIKVMAEFTRYYPTVQDFEVRQLWAWDDVPYLDYDDNEINLPMIAFQSSFICPEPCDVDEVPNMSINPDVTFYYLPGYRHIDLLHGKYSAQDVKQVITDWMDER